MKTSELKPGRLYSVGFGRHSNSKDDHVCPGVPFLLLSEVRECYPDECISEVEILYGDEKLIIRLGAVECDFKEVKCPIS